LKKLEVATIADVEKAFTSYKAAAAKNPALEAKNAKKLAGIVNELMPKSDVSKLLGQAYNIGEGKWAKNVLNKNAEGCTVANKKDKIMAHITSTSAYNKLIADPDTKTEVDAWIEEAFFTEEPS